MEIDEQFIQETGLGLMPEADKAAFIRDATEELESRIGQRIGTALTLEELEEFEKIEDLEQAAKWMSARVPNYAEMATQVFDEFKNEIKTANQGYQAQMQAQAQA